MAASKDFGILALEVYFPKYFISQSDLEIADDCLGKYTKGLEQEALGFCSIEEDINSICLTAVSNLVKRFNLDLRNIGYLEVGTETLIDKSKSTKTVLMQLFEACGNSDVEGVDVKNACFGGTAAFFHAMNWLESSSWDGRLALVVAGDIAVYGNKAARPTGGAGAVAILLGPNAPLIVESGLRAHHVQHTYDFYKPDLSSEFPVVNGQLSVQCYREALIECYRKYKSKVWAKRNLPVNVSTTLQEQNSSTEHHIDYLCFHSPFTRLVRKAFGWLVLNDMAQTAAKELPMMNGYSEDDKNHVTLPLVSGADCALTTSFKSILKSSGADAIKNPSRELDIQCMEATRDLFSIKVQPGLVFARQVGNMYTASLYTSLASLLLSVTEEDLRGHRILMYSYGSGLVAAMFSLTVHSSRSLTNIVGTVSNAGEKQPPLLSTVFTKRTKLTVADFEEILEERRCSHNKAPLKPPHRPDGLFPGAYYLLEVDEQHRRTYGVLPS